jgi:hypothetical protein
MAQYTTGPSVDHTTSLSTGYFVHLASGIGNYYELSILRSPMLPNSSRECEMDFFYYLNGPTIGNLEVWTLVDAQNSSSPWRKLWNSTNKMSEWQRGTVKIGEKLGALKKGWEVQFEALPFGITLDPKDNLAIDDISFINCNPNDYLRSLKCDFEVGFCDWKNQPQNTVLNWARTKGSLVPSLTGPANDHTTGTGYYIYIDSLKPVNSTARIGTPKLPATPSTGNCFTFWYHQYGSTAGTLNVWLETLLDKKILWTKTGTQGNQWRKAQINLVSDREFQVVLEGIIGGLFGDIAIDDTEITHQQCLPSNLCTFEDDWCFFKNSTIPKSFNWTRGNNGTVTNGTGPTTDHTLGKK